LTTTALQYAALVKQKVNWEISLKTIIICATSQIISYNNKAIPLSICVMPALFLAPCLTSLSFLHRSTVGLSEVN